MSLTLILWLALFVALAVLAFRRPAWGVALYMLTFFAFPSMWWWGDPIEGHRWNLFAGIVLLVAVLLSRLGNDPDPSRPRKRSVEWMIGISIAVLVNATLVHYLLAEKSEISLGPYTLLAKFVLLFLMIVAAARTPKDYRIILLSIVLGAGYIGYEATINDRGSISANRLEGIGAPGAKGANECASLMATVVPLAGVLFLTGRRWQKWLMLAVAPMILNVILLCNSRGTFLALLIAAPVFIIAAPRQSRKRALKLLALGALATWLLLGDVRIVDRFLTTFSDPEERDGSAQSRLRFAEAGFQMVADYPLGAGGDGFKELHGGKYLAPHEYKFRRAVHNGYINEACEWGIQGLILRLLFVGGALVLTWKTIKHCSRRRQTEAMLIGAGLITSMTAFLVTCLFGDRLDNEWGYWVAALAVGFTMLYGSRRESAEELPEEEDAEPWADEEEPVEVLV